MVPGSNTQRPCWRDGRCGRASLGLCSRPHWLSELLNIREMMGFPCAGGSWVPACLLGLRLEEKFQSLILRPASARPASRASSSASICLPRNDCLGSSLCSSVGTSLAEGRRAGQKASELQQQQVPRPGCPTRPHHPRWARAAVGIGHPLPGKRQLLLSASEDVTSTSA